MEFWLARSPWFGVVLWIILYVSDYYLTVYSARGFKEIGYFQFEGSFELTPQYQKDIDALKPISRLHIILLILYSLLILTIWWAFVYFLGLPWAYLLYLGMFLLLEVAVHLRHLRNIFLIREIRKNGGTSGQISYKKWFSYRVSAFELYLYFGLFLIVATLEASPFFLGGAIICFANGFKHNRLAKKVKLTAEPPSPAEGKLRAE
ncbi:MAG TPA: hypothetical protein VN843_35800 [Anaerolineales bacterium]|nr:hypothetical protein [Anaerolineales bacterium]